MIDALVNRFGLEIRSANAADATGIADLFRSVGRAGEAAAIGARIEAIRRTGGSVLLALEWGPPSGVIAFNPYATIEREALTALITTLLVAPDARRRGIARLLVKTASQAARQGGCDRLVIAAGCGEDTLLRFCEATGFENVSGLHVRSLRRRY